MVNGERTWVPSKTWGIGPLGLVHTLLCLAPDAGIEVLPDDGGPQDSRGAGPGVRPTGPAWSLAADPVAVAVEVPAVAGVADADRRSAGGARR